MPIEGQAESLDFVRKAALTSLDDKPVLVVELTNPPPDWKAQLRPICSIVFSVKEIPVDPRHNSKIDRNRLNSMLKASDRL